MTSPTGSSRLPVPLAALVGLLSVAAALGLGHLVGVLLSPGASPFVAVGQDVIDLTTGTGTGLEGLAVRIFGSYDKLMLRLGMAVVIGLLAVLAGLVSRRSAIPGLLLIFVLGALGGVAVLFVFSPDALTLAPNSVTRDPNTSPFDLLATLVGLLAGWGAFRTLYHLAGPSAAAAGDSAPAEVSRRGLLTGSAVVAVGALVTGLGGVILASRAGVQESRRAIGPIVPNEPAPSIPAGADFAAAGSPTFITANRDFYRVDINLTTPQLRAEDWRLRIHGMVHRELNLDWADLTSRPLVERAVTMTCVSNEVGGHYISTANFTGVLLAGLLAEAGVQPGADQLFTTSVDGWTCGSPTADVADPDRKAMLAIGMNSVPLPVEHGFPVRMLVPGLYGFVSGTKWIVDMELTTFDARQPYWLQRGWGQQAPVKTMSRIDSPGSFGQVSPDSPLTGIAWAQTRGIERVEVRVDGGQWQVAELSTEVSRDTWRMWRLAGRLPPGSHVAEVRATDKTGYTQTEDRAAPIPDGASGWHRVAFTVR